MGVLEVFAQSAVVGHSDGPGLETHVQESICPPCLLQRPSASCIYAATESASPVLTFQVLKQLALENPDKVIILSDVPDNAKANVRGKKYMSEELRAVPNLLYDSMSGCCVHKLHRFIAHVTGEEKVVGHVHACQFVMGIESRRRTLEGALRALVSRELHVFDGPPPEGTMQNELLANQTALRFQKLVRARVGDDASLGQAKRGKTLERAVGQLTAILNGTWSRPEVEHFCCGCCQATDMLSKREVQVNNVVGAILGAGICGGLNHTVPAKSRWLTTAGCLAHLCFGMQVHGILPRVWRLAFGEWSIPRAVDDPDDFHRVVRSKVYRAKLWLSHEDTAWKALTLSVCTAPSDHLMQQIQLSDAQGMSLRSLLAPVSNPFKQCGVSYVALLTAPDSPVRTVICAQYQHLGIEVLGVILRYALATSLELAARVWRHLASYYDGWPYKLLHLASSRGVADKQRVAEEVCGASECCLDDTCSTKALRLGSRPCPGHLEPSQLQRRWEQSRKLSVCVWWFGCQGACIREPLSSGVSLYVFQCFVDRLCRCPLPPPARPATWRTAVRSRWCSTRL